MNVIAIDGRLTKKPEIKEKNGKSFLLFSIANQRDKEHTEFIECVAFENTAKFIAKYFDKGDGINIQGTLKQSLYDKDGTMQSVVRVVANNVSFPIKQKNSKEEKPTSSDDVWESAKNTPLEPDDLPFY